MLGGRLTVGDLVASVFYAFAVAQGLAMMWSLYALYSRTAGASERLFELLDIKPDIEDAPGAITLGSVRGHIRFERASFGYVPWTPVLRDIDIDVAPGASSMSGLMSRSSNSRSEAPAVRLKST